MAKTLAGVLAVSIAALLFAACGGSGLSPAQEERCDSLQKKVEGNEEINSVMMKFIESLPPGDRPNAKGAIDAILEANKRKDEAEKERASLGCP